MKNILFPTDFSQNSRNAIEYALELFKDVPCHFYLLHVDALSESGVDSNSLMMPPKVAHSTQRDRLADTLAHLKALTTHKEHHCIALHEFGNLIDIIRKSVVDNKIDLIVMGTKGASGIKETILGSNSGHVLTKVPCNLLMVPEKAAQNHPKEIAFPTDYNIFYSHAILEAISQMLQLTGANLSVVNVSRPGVPLNNLQIQNRNYLKDYLLELHEESHNIYHLKRDRIKSAIEQFVVDEKINLVIMVAKNLNFLQQLLFNSTIKKISFQTSVPLLVLHE